MIKVKINRDKNKEIFEYYEPTSELIKLILFLKNGGCAFNFKNIKYVTKYDY